jgi:hypothetical protein
MGRWERFHQARSITAEDMLADEVVKTLVSDLTGWPPPVSEWFDAARARKFAPAIGPGAVRPSSSVIHMAFELARWELERCYEALDDFARNDRAAAVAKDPRERLALEFLHAWLTDSMLELLEVTRLKRPKLIECLARAEARLTSRTRPPR